MVLMVLRILGILKILGIFGIFLNLAISVLFERFAWQFVTLRDNFIVWVMVIKS